MNILETIIASKKVEVEQSKKNKSISELTQHSFYKKEMPSLKEYLLRKDKTGIIAEFKRKSPSKGTINDNASVEEIIAAYVEHNASAISVLTDQIYFGGTLDDLAAATVHEIPVLRKDFMIDEYQLIESKAYGASVILLIAACLTKREVKNFAAIAKNIGLNILLEIHNEAELEHICDDVDVIGINNRDLKTFTVDLNASVKLAKQIPEHFIKISESGIDNINSIRFLQQHGFQGFLMGEKFMKDPKPAIAFAQFIEQLKQ